MATLKFATHGNDVKKVLAWLREMERDEPGAVFVYLQSLWECNSPECNSTVTPSNTASTRRGAGVAKNDNVKVAPSG
jgi:hypothetical protein